VRINTGLENEYDQDDDGLDDLYGDPDSGWGSEDNFSRQGWPGRGPQDIVNDLIGGKIKLPPLYKKPPPGMPYLPPIEKEPNKKWYEKAIEGLASWLNPDVASRADDDLAELREKCLRDAFRSALQADPNSREEQNAAIQKRQDCIEEYTKPL
jgi:hypothetical protein